MNLMVKDAPRREWMISLTDDELYEVLCTQMAWRILNASGKPVEQVTAGVVIGIDKIMRVEDSEIAKIKDDFIRMILSEAKRLDVQWTHEKEE